MKEALFDIAQAIACSFVAGSIAGFAMGISSPGIDPLTLPLTFTFQAVSVLVFVGAMIPVSFWRQKRRAGIVPQPILNSTVYTIGATGLMVMAFTGFYVLTS